MAYHARQPPSDPAQLQAWLNQEFLNIQKALNQQLPYMQLQTLNAAPSKPQKGQLVIADGTNWNPGSGAGCYRYTGGGWAFLG